MPAAAPFVRVDHLVVAVRDLDAATRAWSAVLGRAPSTRGRHPAYGTENVLFGLANCYLELLALGPGAPGNPVAATIEQFLASRGEGFLALALGTDDLDATAAMLAAAGVPATAIAAGEALDAGGPPRTWRSVLVPREGARGVSLVVIQHDRRDAVPPAAPLGPAAATADRVDHVVLFSDDMDGALRFWRDTLGIPERWRREFPERGTVNVGLRLGGVTLELVAPLAAAAGERGERLWGVAFAVADCDAAVARLRAEGTNASDVRTGLAPATRVATVKREGVPTLLIEHARDRERAASAS